MTKKHWIKARCLLYLIFFPSLHFLRAADPNGNPQGTHGAVDFANPQAVVDVIASNFQPKRGQPIDPKVAQEWNKKLYDAAVGRTMHCTLVIDAVGQHNGPIYGRFVNNVRYGHTLITGTVMIDDGRSLGRLSIKRVMTVIGKIFQASVGDSMDGLYIGLESVSLDERK